MFAGYFGAVKFRLTGDCAMTVHSIIDNDFCYASPILKDFFTLKKGEQDHKIFINKIITSPFTGTRERKIPYGEDHDF